MSTSTQLGDRLGIEVLEASSERVVARMPADGNLQPFGIVHGGAYCALGETVGSIAANHHAPEGHIAVGVDLNATHLRSVASGFLTATATALSLGRTVCSHQVEIRDDADVLVSVIRITNLIREDRRPAAEPAPLATRNVDLLQADIPLEPVGNGSGTEGSLPLERLRGMEVGVWTHTVGVSRDIETNEIAVVLSGSGRLTINGAEFVPLAAGTLLRLRTGDVTIWEIDEPIRKLYITE